MGRPRLFPFPSYVAPLFRVRTALQRPCPPWGTPAPSTDAGASELAAPPVRRPEVLIEVPTGIPEYASAGAAFSAVDMGGVATEEVPGAD
jgi:hypothetical protein